MSASDTAIGTVGMNVCVCVQYLETMADIVKQGIVKAVEDLEKENQEKLMQEVFISNVTSMMSHTHTHTVSSVWFSAVIDTACIVSGIGSVKWSSVCPSVCPIDRELQWHAVGLLLSTLRAADIDR